MFKKGSFKKIKFTPGIDDICKPCKNLKDGYCLDVFDKETTRRYNTNSKHKFNYNLDIKLNSKLPDIFVFDEVQSLYDVLIMLKTCLTKEIISVYLWERPKRSEMTFIGIEKALQIIKKTGLIYVLILLPFHIKSPFYCTNFWSKFWGEFQAFWQG